MKTTVEGRIITSCSILTKTREELHRIGMPIGRAADAYLEIVRDTKDRDIELHKLRESIAKLQSIIKDYAERVRQLEKPEEKQPYESPHV